jgi:hypothetical protein
MTQDTNGRIAYSYLSFSHCKHIVRCSRDVTMLIQCHAIILDGEGQSVSPRGKAKIYWVDGVIYFARELKNAKALFLHMNCFWVGSAEIIMQ